MQRTTRLLKQPNVLAEHDPVVQPIYQSSVFRMPDHRVAAATEHAVHPRAYYTRWGNPTVAYLENQVSTLVGTEASLIFPSGMSAITTTLLALLSPGDTAAVSSRVYGDTTRFFLEELGRWGVKTRLFDPAAPDTLRPLLQDGARLVYYETLSNPELRVADVDGIRRACQAHGATSVCDSTFSPPGVLREGVVPADLVIHSMTKYMSGHFAAFGGSLSGPQALVDRIWHQQALLGGCLDPQAAWQISQGLKTLELRVARQSATARLLAEQLQGHPEVEAVLYPGLGASPAVPWLASGGGVLAMALKAGEAAAVRVAERTRVFGLSVSLGGVNSCIEHAESMSHSMLQAMDGQVLAAAGAARPAAGLLRLAVGVEDPQDLLQDLLQALAA
ncbi:trans-sulfuration enzyme family protein [Eleftheria terrae]|uniref:trans-sulfuration enzyme family protein n=1 Tax=Eleftheria terrae TaxID=1597781 RepID=UPI00263A6CD8|nr:PLP-dependent transferase [Eleftheria terrae]WKB55710.1 PLP-dependent transferase [Eleftheria terrae]